MTTRTVWDDLHDIWLRLRNLPVADDAPTTLSSGFFPLEDSPRPKVCNLFPYWRAPASCIANDGASISQQWDPRGWNSGGPEPQPNENRGAPVKPVVGLPRNFYFTTEGRWLFRFQGADLLEFVADDDVWVFVNGRLVLDLGGTHERMRGSVRLDSEGDSAEWTKLLLDGFTPLPGAMGSGTVTGLGLERGRVYEIAFFHADRQPRESNFSFYVPTLLSRRSLCSPSNQ
jgi:fibro-slime domain-containing protein